MRMRSLAWMLGVVLGAMVWASVMIVPDAIAQQSTIGGLAQRLRISALGVGAAAPSWVGGIHAEANYDAAGPGNAQMRLINATSACSGDLCSYADISNGVDANFEISVTDVGAASKYAVIGPSASVNVPFMARSRTTTQELLKTASGRCAAAGGLVASHDSNVTSCAKAATGVYDWNLAAAGFTRTPDCGCTTVSTTGAALNTVCHLDTAGESATVIRTRTRVPGGSDFDTVHNLVCVGR